MPPSNIIRLSEGYSNADKFETAPSNVFVILDNLQGVIAVSSVSFSGLFTDVNALFSSADLMSPVLIGIIVKIPRTGISVEASAAAVDVIKPALDALAGPTGCNGGSYLTHCEVTLSVFSVLLELEK
jgi:hypothetical protein